MDTCLFLVHCVGPVLGRGRAYVAGLSGTTPIVWPHVDHVAPDGLLGA